MKKTAYTARGMMGKNRYLCEGGDLGMGGESGLGQGEIGCWTVGNSIQMSRLHSGKFSTV